MKKLRLTLLLLMTALLPLATFGQEPLTINDETTNSATNVYVPIHGSYCDYGNRSQFIIPAEKLEDMAGGTITKLTFYASGNTTSATFSGTVFLVYLSEV